MADAISGVTTLYYNFRSDYGVDPEGHQLTNLISDEQKQRAREVFEIYGQKLGVQFVETLTQGFTIATGDLRAVDPTNASVALDGVEYASEPRPLENELLLVMDNAERWYDGYGQSADPARAELVSSPRWRASAACWAWATRSICLPGR